MSENKKNKRKRKVLAVSCIFAALIVAGSTFAWFTSKDEVTNRLTATANYGVSLAEDFTPPEDWTPGQEINKDVTAVNTGNVEAFVRLALLDDAKLKVKGTSITRPADAAAASSADKSSWVELKKTASTANTPSGGNPVDNTANEVLPLQSGGTLVVAASSPVSPSDNNNVSSKDYKPSKTGVYIFKRTVYEGTSTAPVTKYSGYYYVASGANGADDAAGSEGNGTFYALETEPGTAYIANIDSDAVQESATGVVTIKAGGLDNVKIATTKEVTISNVATSGDPAFTIAWMKDNTTAAAADKSDAKIIRLTYVGDNVGTDDDVIIDINLATDWNTNWTFKAVTNAEKEVDAINDTGYFFYNKLLAPGATTEKVIDSVTLNGAVTQEAFKEMVYDLTVVLDSIQITPDEANSDTSIVSGVNNAGWGATAAYNSTTGAVNWL